jgi:hypothetical protein
VNAAWVPLKRVWVLGFWGCRRRREGNVLQAIAEWLKFLSRAILIRRLASKQKSCRSKQITQFCQRAGAHLIRGRSLCGSRGEGRDLSRCATQSGEQTCGSHHMHQHCTDGPLFQSAAQEENARRAQERDDEGSLFFIMLHQCKHPGVHTDSHIFTLILRACCALRALTRLPWTRKAFSLFWHRAFGVSKMFWLIS